jgi:hypothetical protein
MDPFALRYGAEAVPLMIPGRGEIVNNCPRAYCGWVL